jgi:hypothetical protein
MRRPLARVSHTRFGLDAYNYLHAYNGIDTERRQHHKPHIIRGQRPPENVGIPARQ